MSSDFEEFEKSLGFEPPLILTERVLGEVRRDLNPPAWRVFSKLSLIHFLTALVTLAFCPQFGWSFWGFDFDLMSLFMSWGHLVCGSVCGFVFLGSSLFVASLTLRPEEVRTIRKSHWLALGALALLSVGFFLMVSPSAVFGGFAVAWLVGAIGGGVFTLEIGWAIRLKTSIL